MAITDVVPDALTALDGMPVQLASRLTDRWTLVKRYTVLLHLYAGTLLCVLFVSWFVSGVVMMYQGYPGLTARERYGAMPALDCTRCDIGMAQALATVSRAPSTTSPRLGMLIDRPIWRVLNEQGRWQGVFADDGTRLSPVSSADGASIARRFLGDASPVRFRETLDDADQWTLTRTVRNQMPLHRYDVEDAVSTRVYVSAYGGEVVSASTRRERWWSWIGAIPHWIYPTMLLLHANEWAWLVIALSGLGTVMSVCGLAIGVWQWRWRRRVRRGTLQPRTPYRDFIMRWHHMLGLLFGVTTSTWVFSGLMSMNPASWSPGSSVTSAQQLAWMGGAVVPTGSEALALSPSAAWRALGDAGHRIKELQITRVAGVHYWVGFTAVDTSAMVDARPGISSPAAIPVVRDAFPLRDLLANAAGVIPTARIIDTTLLTTYDSYYRDQERLLRLPVLRVKFDDPAHTWLYIDPRTGAIAQRREWKSRLERWMYDGLHNFDFAVLMYRRPLWDIVLITLSLGGLLLSISGAVIGWRYAQATLTGQRGYRKR
jgi:hypothetical protein